MGMFENGLVSYCSELAIKIVAYRTPKDFLESKGFNLNVSEFSEADYLAFNFFGCFAYLTNDGAKTIHVYRSEGCCCDDLLCVIAYELGKIKKPFFSLFDKVKRGENYSVFTRQVTMICNEINELYKRIY